jgi:hypothetical protein
MNKIEQEHLDIINVCNYPPSLSMLSDKNQHTDITIKYIKDFEIWKNKHYILHGIGQIAYYGKRGSSNQLVYDIEQIIQEYIKQL